MNEAIKELLNREPFHPFKIVTNSGKSYEIKNPDLVAVGKDILCLFLKGDHFVFIRKTEISAVESTQPA